MREFDVDEVVKQLDDENTTSITFFNISEIVMVVPKRVIAKAGINKRCFWEAECQKLNPPGKHQKD